MRTIDPYVPIVEAEEEATRRRRRRWLVAVAGLALLGLLLAGAWAVSIVTTNEGASTASGAQLVLGAAPASDTSALANRITNTGADLALPIDFTGRWGAIPADATDGGALDPATGGDYELFQVDLTTLAGTRTFFVEVGLNNQPDDFRALQIEFVKVDTACSAADLDNLAASGRVAATLYAETSDSTIVLPNLAGGTTACIGVADTGGARANDADGTFLRREVGADPTDPPAPMPAFFAVLGEHG